MSTGFQITDQYATYFITPTIVDWVDIYSRKVYRDIVIDSLNHCIADKGLVVYGYVVMTNHMHMIVRGKDGNISGILRDFKKYTAYKMLTAIKEEPESRREWLLHRFEWNASTNERSSNYQVWMHDNHAEGVYSEDFFNQKLNYIHNNPVRAGWVEHPEEYVFSSAKALLQQVPGLVAVTPWGF
ncbi:transposase [Flavipsychrobacter stenotrophus]|uniref:Transposase n=1 Tax=Flavipsychrobacter stenotrophus TaxID=2077091 RepID=A0A2S7T0I9_9BACT|nr:transposase [Flavipsychrobacter stenotrophus]PQJ12710.1 transposase [Flavipsychrobacter stenotrophus]